MGDLRIRYPKSGASVPQSFAAYSKDDIGAAWVRGVLLKGIYLVAEGTTIVEPPNWVILFEDVRQTRPGESYTLEVRDGTGTTVRLNPIYIDRRGFSSAIQSLMTLCAAILWPMARRTAQAT
jgi:hypothetical protein